MQIAAERTQTAPPDRPIGIALLRGEPQTHGGITIIPLLAPLASRRSYITLDEAAPRGFQISEVDEHGSVPQLLVSNPLPEDVLLYDG